MGHSYLSRILIFVGLTLRFGYSLDIIKIEVSSVLSQFDSYKATSSPLSETIPTVFLPLRLSVSVDLGRADSDSIVRRELGKENVVLQEWKLCFSIPSQEDECKGLLEHQKIPNLYNLKSGSVNIISVWFEHHHSDGSKDRYASVSLPFVCRDPYPYKGEWFSHLVGGSELTLKEQYNTLSDHFDRSNRVMFGEDNDSSLFEFKEDTYTFTTEYKLRHDIEQFEHISRKNPEKAEWLLGTVVPIFQKVLSRVPPSTLGRKAVKEDTQSSGLETVTEVSLGGGLGGLDDMGVYHFTAQDYADGIGQYYNRLLFKPQEPEVGSQQWDPETRVHLKPDWDASKNEEEYLTNSPHLTVVDGAISHETMHLLRTILEESTIWYETKAPMMGGYVGAYGYEGLHSPVFLKLADEIARSMPAVFDGHPLRFMWAYKYDSTYEGIAVHADQAAVNVNIWLTADESNLDLDHGGLVIYHSRADADEQINGEANNGQYGVDQCDELSGNANITVPYRENRFVIFDSSLYHRTDKFKFKSEKYTDRRINLTLLYGTIDLDQKKK